MSIDQLNSNYRKAIRRFADKVSPLPRRVDGPANPFIITPPKNYFNAVYRVMYFGQETNMWCKEINGGNFQRDVDVNMLFELYRELTDCDGGYHFPDDQNRPFWRTLKKFQKSFNSQGNKFAFIWNNLIKIGKAKGKGRPCDEIVEWQKHWFGIVREELSTFRPDVVVFFTGPSYDEEIEKICPDVEFEAIDGYTQRQFSRVSSDLLPKASFRTYHPGYFLRSGRLDDIANIKTRIVAYAKSNLRKEK